MERRHFIAQYTQLNYSDEPASTSQFHGWFDVDEDGNLSRGFSFGDFLRRERIAVLHRVQYQPEAGQLAFLKSYLETQSGIDLYAHPHRDIRYQFDFSAPQNGHATPGSWELWDIEHNQQTGKYRSGIRIPEMTKLYCCLPHGRACFSWIDPSHAVARTDETKIRQQAEEMLDRIKRWYS